VPWRSQLCGKSNEALARQRRAEREVASLT
jgi:hypothetical protein